MLIAGARQHLAAHALGWVGTGSALAGVAIGSTLSVFFLERFDVEKPAYVQRAILPENGEAILSDGSNSAADDLPQLQALAVEDDSLALDTSDGEGDIGAGQQAQRTVQTEEQTVVLPNGERVIGVNFDLGSAADQLNDLEFSKPIHLNGREVGVASLSIDTQSRLRVSADDLSSLLPGEVFARIDTGASYIGFDELRAGGLEVSYDPLADVVQIVS